MASGQLRYSSESRVISGSGVCKCYNPRVFNGHGDDAIPENKTRHARFPHPNPGGTTGHSTKPTSGQVAGYPPEGEGANESLHEINV
ncbi:MAG: hypothetical protein COT19_03140 [Gallionellales bacterium CG08_land_8_20_14_0_20_59_87]|nr:MAG: hypothetical protein COT19_03140 [Gallionellales bacterium CG08_land_8_20_14_0_20_59_87]